MYTARKAIEDGKYCTAVFIDVNQAFDKAWHERLIHKINWALPSNTHNIQQKTRFQHFFSK